MSFSIGIVGLPNVGKSTLFKALTKKPVEIAAYPFTTINPNVGIVAVPDERLKKLAEIIKPEKVTPTIIEFVDIAGLVKNAHKGEGLGNQFLSQIKNCDAILEVIRAFEDFKIEHVAGEIDPKKDAEIIKTELLLKDSEVLENVFEKLEKEIKSGNKKTIKKFEILKKIKETVSQEKLISETNLAEEEKQEIKEFQFLTAKPILYILNVDEKTEKMDFAFKHLKMNLKLEREISELSEEESEELKACSRLDRLISNCYNILDLISFYTITGGKETRAWTIKNGAKCEQAAGAVHSDFEEKFIKALVIPWQKLAGAKSWAEAKETGLVQTVGREYIVQDGDIIEFKI